MYFLSYERTKFNCYILYLFDNIVKFNIFHNYKNYLKKKKKIR